MKKVDLTTGNVTSVLISLALPVMGGSLLQFCYSLVDTLWVGRLGTDAVASIGSSTFYIGLGYAINALVVVGGGIKISHNVGSGDEEMAKAYINMSLILNTVLAILYSLFLAIAGKSLINFLNINNENVVHYAYLYLMCNVPVLFFAFYNILFTRILGSYGNNKAAFKISAIGAITNMILDPIFIYTLKLGILGAALATLISNIIMFCIYLTWGKNIICYTKNISLKKEYLIQILKLGFPMSFQRILFTGVNIMLGKIIAIYGAEAIAAQKIGLQIESVMLMIVGGLNGAMASFTGQNYGARKFDRMSRGYNIAISMGISYSIFMMLMFLIFPTKLASLFVTDALTIAISVNYLKIISLSLAFATIEMITNGFFTGLGIPRVSAKISISFTLLRIPLALWLTQFFDSSGVWLSIAISSALKGIAVAIYYRLKIFPKLKNNQLL
ncbi:MAG: MATE family efflux transporter [Epulopiscium sp. Nele67-Bin005]|nr:MAG: MATE family efflux transporter [Epulopiscium sp. Nele67-Bin005]